MDGYFDDPRASAVLLFAIVFVAVAALALYCSRRHGAAGVWAAVQSRAGAAAAVAAEVVSWSGERAWSVWWRCNRAFRDNETLAATTGWCRRHTRRLWIATGATATTTATGAGVSAPLSPNAMELGLGHATAGATATAAFPTSAVVSSGPRSSDRVRALRGYAQKRLERRKRHRIPGVPLPGAPAFAATPTGAVSRAVDDLHVALRTAPAAGASAPEADASHATTSVDPLVPALRKARSGNAFDVADDDDTDEEDSSEADVGSPVAVARAERTRLLPTATTTTALPPTAAPAFDGTQSRSLLAELNASGHAPTLSCSSPTNIDALSDTAAAAANTTATTDAKASPQLGAASAPAVGVASSGLLSLHVIEADPRRAKPHASRWCVVATFGAQVYRTALSPKTALPIWSQRCQYAIRASQHHWPLTISLYKVPRARSPVLYASTSMLVTAGAPNTVHNFWKNLTPAPVKASPTAAAPTAQPTASLAGSKSSPALQTLLAKQAVSPVPAGAGGAAGPLPRIHLELAWQPITSARLGPALWNDVVSIFDETDHGLVDASACQTLAACLQPPLPPAVLQLFPAHGGSAPPHGPAAAKSKALPAPAKSVRPNAGGSDAKAAGPVATRVSVGALVDALCRAETAGAAVAFRHCPVCLASFDALLPVASAAAAAGAPPPPLASPPLSASTPGSAASNASLDEAEAIERVCHVRLCLSSVYSGLVDGADTLPATTTTAAAADSKLKSPAKAAPTKSVTAVRRFPEQMTGGYLSESYAVSRWAGTVLAADRSGGKGLAQYVSENAGLVLVADRRTGQLEQEKIPFYLAVTMRFLYQSTFGKLTSRLNAPLLNRLTHQMGKKFNSPASASTIVPFIAYHNIDMRQFSPSEPSAYRTFNDFFYRKLAPGARPLAAPGDPHVAVSPADCRITVFATISDATRLWIKGKQFSLRSLLVHQPLVDQWTDCSLALCRLAPQDYHRFHFPVSAGKVGATIAYDGGYASVNPLAIRSPCNVLTENKRTLTPLSDTPFGPVLLIAVGACMVGSIVITHDPAVQPSVQRGDPFGYFAFGGSTVLVLFRRGSIVWDRDLLETSNQLMETAVAMGESIGRLAAHTSPALTPAPVPAVVSAAPVATPTARASS